MSSKRGIVVSDLHLFSRRSDATSLFETVRAKLPDVDVLVLNGDTFDFRWSHFSDLATSIVAAIDWLESLLNGLRNSQRVYFLQGNHDCVTEFTTAVKQLADSDSRLIEEERTVILGDHLFLHGDGANWKMTDHTLDRFREKWSQDEPRGKISAIAYEAVDRSGISKTFHHLYFPKQTVIRRIAYHLDHATPGWREQVKSVYFGHTHCPFENIELDKIRYFNTGSAIRGMGFNPQHFEFETI